MFLAKGKIPEVHANKDNMEYYNKIYEEGKSEEAKQAARELEEYIKTHQPSWIKRVFCCAKPYTGEEEDEDIESITYSSGESGEDENKLGRDFLKMKEWQKDARIRNLWYKMLAKAKGAVLVLNRFEQLTRRIYLFGTSKKLKFEIEKALTVEWYILLPTSTAKVLWNLILVQMIIYTAFVVPFASSFYDERSQTIATLDFLVDLLFMLDLILNFLMAFEDKDKKMEVRIKYIARNYAVTYLPIDLVACVPMFIVGILERAKNVTIGADNNLGGLLFLNQVIGMVRLLRLVKIVRLMNSPADGNESEEPTLETQVIPG